MKWFNPQFWETRDFYLILNEHGGNEFKPIIRELYQEFPEMLFALVEWYSMTDNSIYFDQPGEHAHQYYIV